MSANHEVPLLDRLRGRLVVSCQSSDDSPFHVPELMLEMARAVVLGGAAAVRVESLVHVAAMRPLGVPVIGLVKRRCSGSDVYITPSVADVFALARAGAAMIATDGTRRTRSGGEALGELVAAAHDLGIPVMADVDGPESAEYAVEVGADVLSTTLAGYTGGPATGEPDIELVGELVRSFGRPVFAEGRYARPDQARRAMSQGAWAVVVGTAISDPVRLAALFGRAVEEGTRP